MGDDLPAIYSELLPFPCDRDRQTSDQSPLSSGQLAWRIGRERPRKLANQAEMYRSFLTKRMSIKWVIFPCHFLFPWLSSGRSEWRPLGHSQCHHVRPERLWHPGDRMWRWRLRNDRSHGDGHQCGDVSRHRSHETERCAKVRRRSGSSLSL